MKARRVVDLVRGRTVAEAAAILQVLPAGGQRAGRQGAGLGRRQRREQPGPRPRVAVRRRAYVDEGPTLKRFQPRAQGRAFRIRKRTCHITIEVVSLVEPETDRGRRSRGDRSAKGRTR